MTAMTQWKKKQNETAYSVIIYCNTEPCLEENPYGNECDSEYDEEDQDAEIDRKIKQKIKGQPKPVAPNALSE